MIIVYLPEDKNTRNGNLEKNQRKANTNMGDNHRYVCYNGSSKQSCGGHASITQYIWAATSGRGYAPRRRSAYLILLGDVNNLSVEFALVLASVLKGGNIPENRRWIQLKNTMTAE